MAEITFRGNAGREAGPGRDHTTHRFSYAPGGPEQMTLLRDVLNAAAVDGQPWRLGRIDNAGPEIVAEMVVPNEVDGQVVSDWIQAQLDDLEMRLHITLELVGEDNRGPDDAFYIAELSRRGLVHLGWTGPAGNEIQTATITTAGQLRLDA